MLHSLPVPALTLALHTAAAATWSCLLLPLPIRCRCQYDASTIHGAVLYLYFSMRDLSLSFDAPTISSTFWPSFHTWKVGMAEMPHSPATAALASTSTLRNTISMYCSLNWPK
eukprot:GHUV01040141.1.p2 GENE.GHUV01040141.1~~GHUV01040141.1.p2  ORF type:complete len:113 (+),score=3.49 GHUV01040141.1:439-777(+)